MKKIGEYKVLQISKMTLKHIFSMSFWKIFLPISVVSLILFFLEYGRYSAFDPAFNPNYLLMCSVSLICWAICISLSIRIYGWVKTLPVACIALLLIAMDYFNYSFFRKQDYYCTVYHSMSIASVFLTLNLFAFYSKCRVISILRTFVFSLLFLFPLAIIGNKIISGSGLDGDAMLAIQQTDIKEAYHYFFGLNNGLILLVWLVIIGFALWLLCRFAFPPFKKRMKRQMFLSMTAVFCALFALLPCLALGYLGNMYSFFTPRMYNTLKYPITYSRALKGYSKRKMEHIEAVQRHLAGVKNDQDCFHGKYVVVIGESLNKNFMGCYGYSKNTTPFQSGLMGNDNFILFKHSFACYVQTQRVLLLLLSNRNQYDGKGYEISDAVSFLDIANLYHYHTEWLSGQERISNTNSVITALAESSNQVYFSTLKMAYRDLDLIQHLEKNNTLGKDNSITVLHLNGNHYPFHLSFPSNTDFGEQKLSSYEKSVFFNDTVMSKLFDLAKANNVDVLLYVSDHSDAVSVGKGHDSRNYLQEMVEIPLWIYVSDAYRKEHPDIMKQLQIASSQVFTNDLVFNLLLYLMGIKNDFVDTKLIP